MNESQPIIDIVSRSQEGTQVVLFLMETRITTEGSHGHSMRRVLVKRPNWFGRRMGMTYADMVDFEERKLQRRARKMTELAVEANWLANQPGKADVVNA